MGVVILFYEFIEFGFKTFICVKEISNMPQSYVTLFGKQMKLCQRECKVTFNTVSCLLFLIDLTFVLVCTGNVN